MKLVNGKLYLTISEVVECGVADELYLRKAKSIGTACWEFMDDPADKRKVLVGYEALNDDRKRKVEVRFGNPYDLIARTPILNMVVNDWKANEYFIGYRYDGNKNLPINRVNQYTRAASWLNMLGEVQADKRTVKKQLQLTIPEFYTHVASLITLEKTRGKMEGYAGIDVLPGDFPSSYQRLLARVDKYKAGGYDDLIDPLYGNKNAAKIGRLNVCNVINVMECGTVNGGDLTEQSNDKLKVALKTANKGGAFDQELADKQMAVIRAIATKHQNFDAGQLADMVNIIFDANGWKTLSRARLHDIITENVHLLTAGRKGKRKYMSTIAMQVKRSGPDMPMKYWTLDGWTVELLYQERGKKGMEYKRMVMVVVLDAFNKYPVGYAIGDRENSELIREANRNALLHVHELFGGLYRPWQVQSDNYSITALTPFYQAMSHLHTPAAVGNAKAKIIEPYFMYLNKEYCQKCNNWSGFNVTANRGNQVNAEYLDKIKGTMPDKKTVIKQCIAIIDRERAAKVAEYTGKWELYEVNNGKPDLMTEMDWLMVFGQPMGERTNRITGQGVEKTINGVKYTYDSFDPAFRANMHLDWQLMGDMNDLSKVLAISPDGKMKFVLEDKRVIPMDVRSATADDHAYRAKITQFNNERIEEVTNLYDNDFKIARAVIEETPLSLGEPEELMLKLMFTNKGQQKENIQNAKKLGTAKLESETTQDILELKREMRQNQIVDFSRYQ